MGKQRLLYLTVLLGAVAFYIFYWDYIAFAALVLVVALPLLSGLLLALTAPFVTTELSAPASMTVRGEPAILQLTVANRGFLAIANARVLVSLCNHFSGESAREQFLFPVNSRDTTTLGMDLLPAHCGVVEAVLEQVQLFDFLGLFRITRKMDLRMEITVLPAVCQISGEAGGISSDEEEPRCYSTQKPGDDRSQVFGVHSYREGDRLKDIHWKLSARLDELMVKEYSLPLASTPCIVWEAFGAVTDPSQLDLMAQACASLLEWLNGRGIPFAVEWYSPHTGRVERISAENRVETDVVLAQLYHSGCPEEPCMLKELLSRPEGLPYSSLLYLTPRLTNEITQQLLLTGTQIPVHVLFAAPERTAAPIFVQELLGMGEGTVTMLQESTAEEELSHFSL